MLLNIWGWAPCAAVPVCQLKMLPTVATTACASSLASSITMQRLLASSLDASWGDAG